MIFVKNVGFTKFLILHVVIVVGLAEYIPLLREMPTVQNGFLLVKIVLENGLNVLSG